MVVDAGDLMWKSKTLGTSRIAQQRVKGRLQMEALVHSGVDAMVLGDADLALGLDWLGQQARELDLPYVATNFTCEGITMPSHRLVEVGDLRVGVLGIIGREQAGACTFKAVVPAINTSISAMGEVDLVVVLSHQDASAERSMAAAVPAVDVVVNGHSKKTNAAPIALGESAVQLGAGSRGKKLGVATLRLTEGATGFRVEGEAARLEKQLTRAEERIQKTHDQLERAKSDESASRIGVRLRRLEQKAADTRDALAAASGEPSVPVHRIHNTLWSLSDDVADHPAVIAMVEAAKPRISAAASLDTSAATAATADSPFVGSAACAGCHAEAQAQWKSTPHASAWSTLVREGRERDLDCWSCHVTGAHHPQGPQHPSQVAGLEDVGCEACHGPGKAHVASPQKANIVRDPAVDVCTDCHDGIKDEGRFDLAKYRPQVLH